MVNKANLRNQMKAQLNNLDQVTYEHYSYQIAQTLFSSNEWKEADTIAITVSNFPEVDTRQIIRKGWEQGKRMVVPKCIPKTREMKFKEISSFAQLEIIYHGLLEPKNDETKEIPKNEIKLMIVPGLAFNVKGYRLGFGGGYYDRYLSDFTGRTLALAFSEQVLDEIPIESFDLPVMKIITEMKIIDCNSFTE
ncbi:5-formyltetrahydrofolate cyclo-ligase [Lederbergia graminis]|uniref:5-formyltetrahydrofolate cyclo-ligase n=1 Tax=Lederbergia graminis TaxID=735518 RepID=A0ABW0LCN0_9BACI